MSQPPLTAFEQTLRDLDNDFRSVFPAAKPPAEDIFGGHSFCYDARSGYTALAENSQSRTQNLAISSPISSLHYDYPPLSENVAGRAFHFPPRIHDSDPLRSQPTQQYTPTSPVSYTGPSAATQIPSFHLPAQHYTPANLLSYPGPSTSSQLPSLQQTTQHYTRSGFELYSEPSTSTQIPPNQPAISYAPEQHISPNYEQYSAFDTLHRTTSPNNAIQSPIGAISPRGRPFFTPDAPFDLASPPRSDLGHGLQESLNRPFIPKQDNRLHVQFPMAIEQTKPLDRTTSHISSPNSNPASQHGYDNRHGRPYPSSDKALTRGMPWADPHPAQRPSVRLSPLPTKRQLEKKPPLACLFCRGRKIACGPPIPGSHDKTCNQCQRRSLRCEYPAESRRGMRKKKTTDVVDKPLATMLSSSSEITGTNPP